MLTLLLAAALAFPVPASPPIPVTTPLLGLPPLGQGGFHVASNGPITLAVWKDSRSGYDVVASRVNADGMPLDPTGILVRPDASVVDVFWTGSSFAILTLPNPTQQVGFGAIAADTVCGYSVTYVGADGTVTQPKLVAPADYTFYAARSSDAPDAHLLFLPPGGFARFARVADLQGKIIRPGTREDSNDSYDSSATKLAASNGSTFLVLRRNQGSFIAETLDLDGGWGGSADPHLPELFVPVALSHDGRGGYVLLGYDTIQYTLLFVHLDARGVSAGSPQVIPNAGSYGMVTANANGFTISWLAGYDHTVAYVSHDGSLTEKRFEVDANPGDTAYDPVNDLLFASYDVRNTLTSYDVFVQKGSAPPVPLTHSANFQTNPAIAAGRSGFLAAWVENSGTGIGVCVRRFTSDGKSLGETEIAATAADPNDIYTFPAPSVTSSGDTYLVTWDRRFARRFDARNARWLDAVPFPLNAMAVASNGSSVLAVTCEAKCPDFPCTMARPVAMSGSAAVSAGTMLGGWDTSTRAAIASDGTNYLAVWDGLAMRLRADGTPIDAAPIVLGQVIHPIPSVAWNGKTYLVAWYDDFGSLYAAYVGSDGAVRQLGTLAKAAYISSLKVVAHDGTFVIFSQQWQSDVTATLVDGSTTTLDSTGFLDAASDGTHLMLTYARIDPQAGRVSRVFLDPRVFPSRKRAVR